MIDLHVENPHDIIIRGSVLEIVEPNAVHRDGRGTTLRIELGFDLEKEWEQLFKERKIPEHLSQHIHKRE